MAADSFVGRRLGSYVIEDLLGEGAMGAVYVATDQSLGRRVALKVIHRWLAADATYCERFLREARAVARLNHPRIVQIYAAGTEEGIPFLALEYIPGGSLMRVLRRAGGKLPARKACEFARDAALALAAAHERGIVHRDVKPDNLLVAPDGRAKLVDFGIACVGNGRLTRSGFFVGTPRYSSPEQCRSEEVDGRSDLYSLGVTLYELLIGDTPHGAETPLELLNEICHDPPPPLGERDPSIPASVVRIVERLLAKEAEQRYDSASELVIDLERAIEGLPPVEIPLESDQAANEDATGSGSGSTDVGRRALFGGSRAPAAEGPPIRTPAPFISSSYDRGSARETEVDPRRGPGSESHAFVQRALSRIGVIDRLSERGKPGAALRALLALVRELVAADALARNALLERAPRDSRGHHPLYSSLGRIVASLRAGAAALRPVPSLLDAVGELARLDVSTSLLAGDLADLLAATEPAKSAPGLHIEAVVSIEGLGIGLPLVWKWDELAGAYEDAVVPLDADGRQQVIAAATVLTGLLAPQEQARVKEFNERRRIVPVVSLSDIGSIAGASAGLPTFLAMTAAYYGLELREGVAATGAIDAATVPSLPRVDLLATPAVHERFLSVRVGRVEAIPEKIAAVLEQCTGVTRILLPAANRSEVEGSSALSRDVAAAGVRLTFIERIEDALSADIFSKRLMLRPLRTELSGLRPVVELPHEPPAERVESVLGLARVGALAALALAAVATLVTLGAI